MVINLGTFTNEKQAFINNINLLSLIKFQSVSSSESVSTDVHLSILYQVPANGSA